MAPGVGVDLYDQSTNTFTTVNSMNMFCPSYAQFNGTEGGEADPSNYTFNRSQIKSTAKRYCTSF